MSDKSDTSYREPHDNPVTCMTIRQHFAPEVYKSMMAGRGDSVPSKTFVSSEYYHKAVKAADGLLAELEKDEK